MRRPVTGIESPGGAKMLHRAAAGRRSPQEECPTDYAAPGRPGTAPSPLRSAARIRRGRIFCRRSLSLYRNRAPPVPLLSSFDAVIVSSIAVSSHIFFLLSPRDFCGSRIPFLQQYISQPEKINAGDSAAYHYEQMHLRSLPYHLVRRILT
mgnify:CR=1 FL=1